MAISPWFFGFADSPAGPWLHLIVGVAIIGAAAMTDFELGFVRLIPMPVHLMLDALIGLVLLLSPLLFTLGGYVTLHVLLGVFELGAALMTSPRPSAVTLRT